MQRKIHAFETVELVDSFAPVIVLGVKLTGPHHDGAIGHVSTCLADEPTTFLSYPDSHAKRKGAPLERRIGSTSLAPAIDYQT